MVKGEIDFIFSKSAKVGDYIKFGNYPQTSNGDIQPIEWQILSIENGKMPVISRYGLEAMRFDSSSNDWKNSEIRKWLNGDFYNKAFTDQDKKYINLSNFFLGFCRVDFSIKNERRIYSFKSKEN